MILALKKATKKKIFLMIMIFLLNDMVDFVDASVDSHLSFANSECKITTFFLNLQNSKYVIKHKSTKSIYDFIDIQRFSSKIGAKKVRKKSTPEGAWGPQSKPKPEAVCYGEGSRGKASFH